MPRKLRCSKKGMPDPAHGRIAPTADLQLSAREAAKAPQDEPRSACGRYGFDGDAASFWRVFQGRSWFFDLGQVPWQIDPGSFTIMAKNSDGAWRQAE